MIRKHPPLTNLMDIREESAYEDFGRKPGGISFMPILERLPVLSWYAKTRGWHYVFSWLHRLAGIALVIIWTVHLDTLSSLQAPDADPAKMRVIVSPVFLFLAWASSLVVGFHALNGGRLTLYELFGRRNDADMIRWIFGLSAAYAAMVGLLLIMKNQKFVCLSIINNIIYLPFPSFFISLPPFLLIILSFHLIKAPLFQGRGSRVEFVDDKASKGIKNPPRGFTASIS